MLHERCTTLAGKVAVVTGGGMGRGYALRLAEIGADIVIPPAMDDRTRGASRARRSGGTFQVTMDGEQLRAAM